MSPRIFGFAVASLLTAALALYIVVRVAIWAVGFAMAAFALLLLAVLVQRARARRRG